QGGASTDATIAVPAADLPIGGMLNIFEDPSGAMSLADVRRAYARGELVPAAGKPPRIGFSRSAWWGQFTLVNNSPRGLRQIVEFRHPVIDRLEFYRPTVDGSYEVQVTGDSVVGRSTDLLGIHNVFVVAVHPHS